MDVGFLLAVLNGAGACMLDQFCQGVERTVRPDRQGGEIAAAVVGDQRPFPAGVHRNIAWVGASARLLVDKREFAGSLVEREGAYSSGLRAMGFVDAVKEPASGGDGQIGGVVGGRFLYSVNETHGAE